MFYWIFGIWDGGGGYCFFLGYVSVVFVYLVGVWVLCWVYLCVVVVWGVVVVVLGLIYGVG